LTALVLAGLTIGPSGRTLAAGAVFLAVVASGAFVLWRMDPVWSFAIALLLAPMSGNWSGVGIPGIVSPNRIVLAIAVASVLFRGGASRDRPRIRLTAAHVMMALTAAYVIVSAFASSTLFDIPSAAAIVERYGLLPFLVFFAAPAVFRTDRDRERLLLVFIAFGAYLGLTALFETIGLRALVFPRYISDPTFGFRADRARGPFVEPGQDGLAMFTCACACVMFLAGRRRATAKVLVVSIGVLCLVGVLFTLTRAAWVGAAAGAVAATVAAPGLRRFALPLIGGAVLAVAVALAVIPGLSEKASSRESNQGTVIERYALNRAGLNMIEARPLFGFGWARYFDYNRDYLEQGADYSLPPRISRVPIHNLYLNLGVELGLVGLLLWLAAVTLAVGGAIVRRGPPAIQPWRWMLLAVAVFYVSLSSLEPTVTFSSLLLFLLAGVVHAGHPDSLSPVAED
jgi:O-antigen ligase